MILVAGSLTYAPGAIQGLRDEMLRFVEATRREDGCINYDLGIDTSDPTRLILFERWRDQKALDRHFSSPHMAEWRKAVAAAGPVERDLSVWEVNEGRVL